MSLSPGTRLGHYDVTALLGEGGMGQVWQATDTQLNRQVALKILPDAFADDPDRLARFQREAQVLASLNHPNIAAIYGIEKSDDTQALVLELVEGPTLADRMAQGPIPLDEALPIARQIAEALEAAHEQGVIHRDLKPANIKVREDGTVKVLDFGLAKALDTTPEGDPSQSPTLTAAATQMGVIMGTAAYMSPEQARGKPVDKRADIWAFGAVLYEMLTGQKPFAGDDISTTLAQVIEREPDWEPLPVTVSPGLGGVLRRCLRKEPRERIQAIGDVRLALEGGFEIPGQPAQVRPGFLPQDRGRPLLASLLGTAIAASVITGVAMWFSTRPQAPDRVEGAKRFTIPVGALPRGVGGLLALSPDGKTVVYAARQEDGVVQHLFRRWMDDLAPAVMRDTQFGRDPAVSIDGEWLFFRGDNALRKMPLAGGRPQTVSELPGPYLGLAWAQDDMLVVGGGTAGLLEIPAAGGPGRVISPPPPDRRFSYPQVLEGGRVILHTSSERGNFVTTGALWALFPETGERRLVVEDALAGRLLPSGHLVFWRSNDMWAVPFDTEQLSVNGTPVPVVEDVSVTLGGSIQFAVSDEGTLAYLRGSASESEKRLVWIDPTGQEEDTGIAGLFESVALSPTGDRLAVGSSQASGNADVLVFGTARGEMTRITSDGAFDGSPLWSPDGDHLVYTSEATGRPQLIRSRADGTGEPEVVASFDADAADVVAYSWAPDGTNVFVARRPSPAEGADVGVVAADGSSPWRPVIATEAHEYTPAISPSGDWLAFTSDETGRNEVYVQRWPDGGARQPVSVGGGHNPRWSQGSDELFYERAPAGPPDAVIRVSFERSEDGSATLGEPTRLFPWRYFTRPGGQRSYDVTSEGSRFVAIRDPVGVDQSTGTTQIDVVLGWFGELSDRVPIP